MIEQRHKDDHNHSAKICSLLRACEEHISKLKAAVVRLVGQSHG